MYKATVTKSLSDLKRLDFGPLFFMTAVSGVAVSLVGNKLGEQAMLYSLMLFLLFTITWLLTGSLKWRANKGELILTQGELRLKWMSKEELTVVLEDVSPRYQIKYYRPLGILPKKPYIHLMLDGGLLGPHEFFFFHDGEYNASQWDKLPLQQIVDGVGIVNA